MGVSPSLVQAVARGERQNVKVTIALLKAKEEYDRKARSRAKMIERLKKRLNNDSTGRN